MESLILLAFVFGSLILVAIIEFGVWGFMVTSTKWFFRELALT